MSAVPAERAAPAADDARLVDRVARGDDAALALLYDRHGVSAYALACRVLRDRSLAEDAVQEGFLCVWRNAGRYRVERGTVAAWILTLVHRRAVDILRREGRSRTDRIDGYDQRNGDDALAETLTRQRRTRVQAALARIAPEQRRALELAYYGGYSQSEIAAHERVPLGTVKSRVFAGLTRMRALLE